MRPVTHSRLLDLLSFFTGLQCSAFFPGLFVAYSLPHFLLCYYWNWLWGVCVHVCVGHFMCFCMSYVYVFLSPFTCGFVCAWVYVCVCGGSRSASVLSFVSFPLPALGWGPWSRSPSSPLSCSVVSCMASAAASLQCGLWTGETSLGPSFHYWHFTSWAASLAPHGPEIICVKVDRRMWQVFLLESLGPHLLFRRFSPSCLSPSVYFAGVLFSGIFWVKIV